jgi:hypothetical protein
MEVEEEDNMVMPRATVHEELFDVSKWVGCPNLHQAQVDKLDPKVIEALPQSREAVWQVDRKKRGGMDWQ